jgi:hypothetical protein
MDEPVSALIETLRNLRISNLNTGEFKPSFFAPMPSDPHNTVAATALLAYEIVIISGQEIKFVWR